MLELFKLFGLDAGGYDRWQLRLAGEAGSLLVVFLALLAIAAAGIAWWQVRERRKALHRRVLLALRWSAIALLLVLLLEPEIQLLKTVPVRRQVLVGIDATPSMTIADAAGDKTRLEAVSKLLAQDKPWQQFEEEHDVRYFTFSGLGDDYSQSESARAALAAKIPAGDGETDLAAALRSLAKISRERSTAGVILISDGADLGALADVREDPGALAGFLKRNDLIPAAPLTTVRVGGQTSFPDLAIRRVDADEYGFIRNQVQVGVTLAAQGLGVQQVPVTIRLGQDVVATQTAVLPDGGGEVKVDLGFSPTLVGEFVYNVEVPVLAGERLSENNRREFKIKIIRDKVRVLHVVGKPSWDERFLRTTLKDDPNIDLVSFMILRELVALPFREDELSLIPFPTDEIFDKKLHTFDLVIFQNFQYYPRYGIQPNHLRNIRDFVMRDGGGFVMIGGEQSFVNGQYAGTPIEEILPVSLRFSGSLLEEGKSISGERFAPQLPGGGTLHPVMRLHYDPERSAQMWRSLPPLDGMNRVGDLVPGAVALLQHPTLRTPGGAPAPVLAAANMGKGRTLSIATDSSWYWHFQPVDGGGTNDAYLSFWREAIRWLTRDPALKQLNITTDRERYRPGEEIVISVSVLDPEYRPVDDAKVDLSIRSLDGKPLCRQSAQSLGGGRYEARCTAAGTGYAEILATATRQQGPLGSETAYVEIVALSREFERTAPDEKLLGLLADLGGGKALTLEDGQLSGRPALVEEQAYRVLGSRELPLWDTPLALLLAIGLLSLEWWLRRRWGMS